LDFKHLSDEVKHMEKRAIRFLALATTIAVITVLGGILMYTVKCAGPAPEPATADSSAPPITCDGSPIGSTKKEECPKGQAGAIVQVCTSVGWLDATNTCASSAPTCTQTTFEAVQPIYQKNCVGCHAQIGQYAVAQSWSAESSRRVGLPTGNNDHMPQGTAPQLSSTEISTIQKWVTEGAIQDCTQASIPAFIDLDYINKVMVTDASSLSITDRPFTRYLITSHAVNAGEKNAVWIQAMNKTLNSLNGLTEDLFKAQAIDPTQSVWRIDLRNYGMNAAKIALVDAGDVNINIVDTTSQGLVLQSLIGSKHPWFHADNFIDITHRNSTVYYGMLNIPATLAALQAQIGVNFQNDLANLTINFIGSASSPIAEQKNRLLVRTVQARSVNAYYWQTFDVNNIPNNIQVVVNGVLVNENTKNIFQFPLLAGTGAAVSTPAVAVFTSDASEAIYTLPNGLQGYVLTDAVGNVVNFADPNVVIDTQTPLGNKVINASNSCNRCHNQGVIPMVDQVLASTVANKSQFTANDVQLVQSVYKAAAADLNFFKKDNSVFAKALNTIGVDPKAADPMSVVTDRFLQNWDLKMIGALLFLTPEKAANAISTSPTALAQIGGLLTPGGTVTFQQFIAVEQQLIKDARLFQDPI